MIDSDTALFTTIIFSLICLVYSITITIIKKLFSDVTEDYKKLKTGQQLGFNDDKEAFLVNFIIGADQRALSYQDSCKRVLKECLFLYTYQSISMVVAAVIFSITFLIWFEIDGQYAWLLYPFLTGCVITALNTFIVLLLTNQSRPRVLFASQEDKEVTFSEGYIINNAITTALLSVFIFTLLFVVPQFEKWYFEDFDKKKHQESFFFNTVAFTLGTCLASIFYRDLGGNLGKGMSIGSTTIDNNLRELGSSEGASGHNNLKNGEIIGNYYTQNVTSTLDLQCLISTLIVATNILSDGKDNTNETTFYLVLYLLSLNTMVTFIIAWLSTLFKDKFQLQSTSSYVAKQIRIQYIVINIISFILLFFLPVELVPKKISIGKDGTKNPSFYDSDISLGDLIWCLQIGQVISFILVFCYEFWTSYGFSMTTSFSYGVVYAESQGNLLASLVVFLLGFTVFFAYYFGGVFGLNWITIGIIQTAPMLLGVCFFSLATNDSVITASLNGLDNFCNRLRLISWASNNFSSFIQLINITGGFFVNLLCVFAVVAISSAQKDTIFDGGLLLGFILGVSMIYLLQFLTTIGIQDLASKLISSSKDVQFRFSSSNFQSLNQLILSSFTPSFYTVFANLLVVLAYILLIGLLLGKSSLIGFTLGITIFGLFTSLRQLVVGNSLKNAQNYIDQSALISGNAEFKVTTTQSKDSGYIAQALYQIPGTGVHNYINLALIITVIGVKVLSTYGYFDAYMQKNSSKLSASTVDWYLDLVDDKDAKF